MFLFKERHLERQDGEKFIHIAFDILNSEFFPSPNLRRNIVKHLRSRGVGVQIMDILCNAKIEARIIHQNPHIGPPLKDILLTKIHILEDGAQME